MIRIKNTLILTSVLFISACGYQLRGSMDLPEGLKSIYLQAASSQLTNTFKRTLSSSGGELVEQMAQAGIVVQLVKEKMDRRVLSLSSTGRANEYEIIYSLKFTLLNAAGKVLFENQTVEINRDYFNDQEDVLGKNNEEQTIREEMYRQAVQKIISRARIALEKVANQ